MYIKIGVNSYGNNQRVNKKIWSIQKNVHDDKEDYTYVEGKKFEITGGAFFRQVFSFGKIEYTYKKNNKLYVILPLFIHFSGAHDDGGWTDWEGDDEKTTLVFNVDSEWSFNEKKYVAFEIPEGKDSCQVTRFWGIYSGWKEDGVDDYYYTPIMIHFKLDHLSSLPRIEDEILKDGFLIMNNQLVKCYDDILIKDNVYKLDLLEEKYNYIEVIKSKAFNFNTSTIIQKFQLPISCKKIEDRAFIDCYFHEFVIPSSCNVEFDEYVFEDCYAVKVYCPRKYEEIFKKVFDDAKIVINDSSEF